MSVKCQPSLLKLRPPYGAILPPSALQDGLKPLFQMLYMTPSLDENYLELSTTEGTVVDSDRHINTFHGVWVGLFFPEGLSQQHCVST